MQASFFLVDQCECEFTVYTIGDPMSSPDRIILHNTPHMVIFGLSSLLTGRMVPSTMSADAHSGSTMTATVGKLRKNSTLEVLDWKCPFLFLDDDGLSYFHLRVRDRL
jgi:hypothetical protein